ncbi:hypothetical protein TanjilG_22676 [Lupinus angustifolius]|uniref:Uncharacterized protein n=1 Tax=Lupinus angustifolius TaxID=3871 RepID=A0A1J7GKF5_LUPAN|nr:hypothetical protein TanjilG_22676 [Lupinus angustifolius]
MMTAPPKGEGGSGAVTTERAIEKALLSDGLSQDELGDPRKRDVIRGFLFYANGELLSYRKSLEIQNTQGLEGKTHGVRQIILVGQAVISGLEGEKSSILVWSLLKAIKREKQELSNHHVVQGRKIYQVQVHIGAKGIPANLSLHHNE